MVSTQERKSSFLKVFLWVLVFSLVFSPFIGTLKVGAASAAQWIWDATPTTSNSWVAFRKTVNLPSAPSGTVTARIAVDSKYWLYINDELVVFEGGLKRGPNPTDTYVDLVDIAPYLKSGSNTIAIQAWYFGKNGYSHLSSGKAGLFFEASGSGVDIISDNSWKVAEMDAYQTSDRGVNARLSEENLFYVAADGTSLEGWKAPAFNDSAWAAASEYGIEGTAPWNAFVDRNIPLFAFDEEFNLFDLSTAEIKETSSLGEAVKITESDYVIEAKFQLTQSAFGIVFGYKDEANLNMWQIFGTSASSPNSGKPYLKPHVKTGNAWSVTGAKPEIDVAPAEKMTHYYVMRLEISGNQVKTYVDGALIDTRTTTWTDGAVGFRADPQEKGTVEYIKVSNADGSVVHFEDDFSGLMHFSGGNIINGKLEWKGTGTEISIYKEAISATQYGLRLPVNFQFTPYLKVDAQEAGSRVNIWTDKTNVADGPAHQATYFTKAGVQEYESLAWLNGDMLYFALPDGVEVEELGYRRSGYAADETGYFLSDDPFMNTLWIKSKDTLLVTMRDNYMDCPDRERAQWWGDAVNEIQMAFYALSPEAGDLGKKGIGNVLGFAKPNGVILTVAPTGTDQYELPAQSLAGVMSFYQYYEYSGDDEHFAEAFEKSDRYLMLFNMGSDGVVEHRTGSWNWSDWGSGSDQKLISNCWYYLALDATIKMGEKLGLAADPRISELEARKLSIEENFDDVFWDGAIGYHTQGAGLDDRGNALAVYTGLASKDKYPKIKSVLTTVMNASPYMEKYVLEALFLMGYENEGVARIKTRYTDMVESDYSTLWEFWDPNAGTQNHAWTGGPLTMMSMYMTGVAPIEPGYDSFRVRPQISHLKSISTRVPTIKGNIDVEITAPDEDHLTMSTTVPAGTTAVVGVPLIGTKIATTISHNGEVVWKDGNHIGSGGPAFIESDDRYAYFEATTDIEFSATRGLVKTLKADTDDHKNMKLSVDGNIVDLPYEAIVLEGEVVDLSFIPKYPEEYTIASLDGIELPDETLNDYTVTMDRNVEIFARTLFSPPLNLAKGKSVTATHAMSAPEEPSWGANNLTDGARISVPSKSGFTTTGFMGQDISATPQEIVIDLGEIRAINSLYMYPRTDATTAAGGHANYPADFTIEISDDGTNYAVVDTLVGETAPEENRGEYNFVITEGQFVKIKTTRLGEPAGDEGIAARYRVQLVEVEVYGDISAQEVANTITTSPAPKADDLRLILPKVQGGFTIAIDSVSPDNTVVAADAAITPPLADTTVTVVYKVTKTADNTTGTTAPITLVVPAGTQVTPEVTAQEIADGISAITNPSKDQISLVLPTVPSGFKVEIASVTPDTLVLGLDGTIVPPVGETTVGVVLTITKEADSTTANTVSIVVTIPAATQVDPIVTAQEIADGIRIITAPSKDAVKLVLPTVPIGFKIEIDSVAPDNSVVALNGTITPPETDCDLRIVLKVTKTADSTTARTEGIAVTIPAATQVDPIVTAQEIADGISTIGAPSKGAVKLVLPTVPSGFKVEIDSVAPDNSVVALNGTITPPETDCDLSIVLKVTKTADGTTALTKGISVLIIGIGEPEEPEVPKEPENPGVAVVIHPRSESRRDPGTSTPDKAVYGGGTSVATGVTKAQAQKAATTALAISGETGKVSVRLKNPQMIDKSAIEAVLAVVGDRPAEIVGDNYSSDGKVVETRVTYPVSLKNTAPINLSAFTSSPVAKGIVKHFEKYFSNKFFVLSLGQKEDFETEVKISAKLPADFPIDNIQVYSFDPATNKVTRLENSGATVDSNGYLSFSTKLGGSFVISDGMLKK